MNIMKSVIILAVVTLMAGFVGWHVMWMVEVVKKDDSGKELNEVIQEIKALKKERRRRTVVNDSIVQDAEEKIVFDQEKQSLKQRDAQNSERVYRPAQPVVNVYEEQPVRKFGAVDIDYYQEAGTEGITPEPVIEDGTTIQVKDKTMSITIKSKRSEKTLSRNVARKRVWVPSPQPTEVNSGRVNNVTPHPTSTMP